MLEFQNITVTLGNKKILDNVSFSIQKGRICVLLGKNGSGKSTLINTVTNAVKYKGNVRIFDESLRDFSARGRAKLVSVFPQILPETSFTVKELVSFGRNPYVSSMGMLSLYDRRSVAEAIDRVGISDLSDRTVLNLSGGERQKAFFAMMLAQDTPFMILDEPSTYLDSVSKRELYSLVKTCTAEYGKTVLIVLHDLSDVLEIADDIAVIDAGKLTFFGEVKKALDDQIIEKTFSVRRFDCSENGGKRIFFA
ncbi:MAG: ABC transporter ATP-binding protein [Clostridia bacterium]|nr:ABC transporter ATP-binding protein [Clostridia bacterium]